MKSPEDQVMNQLLPRLIAHNCLNFDYVECSFQTEPPASMNDRGTGIVDFSEANKEGCGRVCFYKELGLIHSYTLECNYQTGKRVNHLNPRAFTKVPADISDTPSLTKPAPGRVTLVFFCI